MIYTTHYFVRSTTHNVTFSCSFTVNWRNAFAELSVTIVISVKIVSFRIVMSYNLKM